MIGVAHLLIFFLLGACTVIVTYQIHSLIISKNIHDTDWKSSLRMNKKSLQLE